MPKGGSKDVCGVHERVVVLTQLQQSAGDPAIAEERPVGMEDRSSDCQLRIGKLVTSRYGVVGEQVFGAFLMVQPWHVARPASQQIPP